MATPLRPQATTRTRDCNNYRSGSRYWSGRNSACPRVLGRAPCPSVCSAVSDWSYGGYSAPADWSATPGAHADPRAASPRQYVRHDGPPDAPSTSYDSLDGGPETDPLSEIARSAVEAVAGCLAFLVARLSDAVLSLLPPRVKRRAVENSVKGGLALLGLALLQSVLSLVLTVGTMVLAVYAAHQVFGVRLPFLPPSAAAAAGGEGPTFTTAGQTDPRFSAPGGYGGYGASQTPPGYHYYGAGPASHGYGPARPGAAGYGGWSQPYGSTPGGGGAPRGQRPAGARQGPTIDVYYDSQ